MSAPFEVLAGPFTAYLAPTATAFPDVSADPSGSWTKLGTTGDENYDDNGVTLALSPSYSEFTPAGSTAPKKVWRVSEALEVSFNMVDMTAAQFAKTVNDATVTAVAASTNIGGASEFDLLQGDEVTLFALLLRKAGSASGDDMNTQFQVPIVYNAGQPSLVFKKGEPAGIAVKFTALKDSSAGFGKYVEQTAAAL